MPHRIAERLRCLALKCQRIAARSKDRELGADLEGISTEIAEEARVLDEILEHIGSGR